MSPLDPTSGETSAPEVPGIRRWFFGADGLRAGWRLVLFLLLVLLCATVLGAALASLHPMPHPGKGQPLAPSPATTALTEGVSVLSLLLPALLMSTLERRPFAAYGFAPRRALADLLAGLFWGVVNLSVLVAALYATHGLAFDGLALTGAPALTAGLAWFSAFALVGLFEEFCFRGYVQFTLARGLTEIARAFAPDSLRAQRIGFWSAAFLLSVGCFTAAHLGNSGETPAGIVAVGLAGLLLVFSLWRTGALWWAIGWHAAWDWAQSCLFGTPDSGQVVQLHILNTHPVGSSLLSGGTDGPEGSLLVIPALLLAAAVVHITLPRRPPEPSAPEAARPGV